MDRSIYNAFDKYVGALKISDDESSYKNKVLKDLSHAVTSRLLLSMIKRNKITDIHVVNFEQESKHYRQEQPKVQTVIYDLFNVC